MSRNGTAVFNEMLAALDKFEEIIKDGVAPFVVALGTSGVAAGTTGEAAVATGTDGVPTGSQKGSSVPTVTEDTNRAKDVETAPTSILSKRQPTSSASENSDTSTPATFKISKSAKSRGRPKVRKQQKVSGKKERMTRGKEKATKLKAIAGIFTSEESEKDIRYIFPQWFVTKAQSAIQQFRKAVPEYEYLALVSIN
ncbi:hypothetical protein PInf_000200 [Phytophthora infestans]|nr:hypothetical protein PInf_000200 [Phytophthora infestans]